LASLDFPYPALVRSGANRFDVTYQLLRQAGVVQVSSALFGWSVQALVADEQEGGQLSQSETLGSEADDWRMKQQQAGAEPQVPLGVSGFCPEPNGQSRPVRNRVAGAVA